MVILLGVASFGIVAFVLSLAMGKRTKSADQSEVSASVLLVSWDEMLFGMYLMRFS
ncbi:MAG: hypothetical protein OEW15_05450 [Nitrospirota bacterium]|nr:hypothetical protein [Nitrospirota bacterium]